MAVGNAAVATSLKSMGKRIFIFELIIVVLNRIFAFYAFCRRIDLCNLDQQPAEMQLPQKYNFFNRCGDLGREIFGGVRNEGMRKRGGE
jgi:hypothetical protein